MFRRPQMDIWKFPFHEPFIVASNLIDITAVAVLFLVLARLARRLRDGARLERTSRLLIWGNLIPGVLAVTAFFGIMLLAPTGPPGGAVEPRHIAALALFPIGCASGIAMIVFWVWSIVALVRFRRAFRVAAERAAENWTA